MSKNFFRIFLTNISIVRSEIVINLESNQFFLEISSISRATKHYLVHFVIKIVFLLLLLTFM